MIPRKKLDIAWRDLLFGMSRCLIGGRRNEVLDAFSRMAPPERASFFLSARSGFDATLQALELPRGGEVLVSAITIPDMLVVLRAHGLVPVPIDLDPETLCPDLDSLKKGIGKKTIGILVTHLFGARVPMNPIVLSAGARGLFVFEDCSQGYSGDDYKGHPRSDVCLFSFGPIKHNTSLGGALVFFRDMGLLLKVNLLHASYPVQSRWRFFSRLAKFGVVSLLGSLTRRSAQPAG